MKFNNARITELKAMVKELKTMEQMGIKAAEEYAKNLKTNENMMLNPISATSPNPSATPIGVNTPNDVISAHAGMSSAEAYQAIELVKKTSTITENDPSNVASPMVREQLTNTLIAKDLSYSIDQYTKSVEQYNTQATSQLASLKNSNTNLNSTKETGPGAEQPQVASNNQNGSLGGTAQAANAAGGMGGLFGGNNSGARNNNTTASPILNGSTLLTQTKDKINANKSENIELTEAATTSAGTANTSATSSLKESLARDLSNRLGINNASGASRMAASKSASAAGIQKLDAKGKPLSPDAQKIAAAIGNADLGGGSGMDFNSSEINSSMQEMMGDHALDSGSLVDSELAALGARELASEQGAIVIQSEESAPLFERVRECHKRNIKTGKLIFGGST